MQPAKLRFFESFQINGFSTFTCFITNYRFGWGFYTGHEKHEPQ